MKEPFGIGKSDAYISNMADALDALKADLEAGGEYPDAEHRIATRFKIKHSELREAYDEWSSITHHPEEYL